MSTLIGVERIGPDVLLTFVPDGDEPITISMKADTAQQVGSLLVQESQQPRELSDDELTAWLDR